jgi:hypothetical protein
MAFLVVLALTAVVLPGAARAAELSPSPVWQGDTLLGPARAAAQLVKATFTYNTTTKALVFKLGSKTVQMTLGSTSAKVNGKSTTLPVAPKTINDTSYVPLKTLFIGLGLQIHASGSNSWLICTDQMCIPLKVPPKPQ